MLARLDTKVRGRFCVKRCGPSRRRVRDALAVLKNFVRQPEKTFSTVSVTCGRRPGKNFLTCCSIGRVRSRVRPVDAAGVATGPNAVRESGPNRRPALEVR